MQVVRLGVGHFSSYSYLGGGFTIGGFNFVVSLLSSSKFCLIVDFSFIDFL